MRTYADRLTILYSYIIIKACFRAITLMEIKFFVKFIIYVPLINSVTREIEIAPRNHLDIVLILYQFDIL